MEITLDCRLGAGYKNPSQKIKNISELWVGSEAFCPACGYELKKFENNKPVADFCCSNCIEEYELKSQKNKIGNKVTDGAYCTMIERLQSNNNPSFFFLSYNENTFKVNNFFVVPKHFFTAENIIKRSKGLPSRPDYIMCSINLSPIPLDGRIFYVQDGNVISKNEILKNWKKTLFLRDDNNLKSRGWILDTMKCIDKIGSKEFTLDKLYLFENELKRKYPKNNFIKDKLRQQLQILRNKGYIEFVERGRYRLS